VFGERGYSYGDNSYEDYDSINFTDS
jgi:hypothetical protein